MSRALLTTAISLGPINVPVKVFAGVSDDKGVSRSSFHDSAECHGEIGQSRYCKSCGAAPAPVVYGIMASNGRIVAISDDDKNGPKEKDRPIVIEYFVPPSAVPLAMGKTRWLGPAKASGTDLMSYHILASSLMATNRLAYASVQLRSNGPKRAVIIGVSRAGVLTMTDVPFSGLISEPPEVPATDISSAHLAMMSGIISGLTRTDPIEPLPDARIDEIAALVEARSNLPQEEGKWWEPEKTTATAAGAMAGDMESLLKAIQDSVSAATAAASSSAPVEEAPKSKPKPTRARKAAAAKPATPKPATPKPATPASEAKETQDA